MDKPLTRGDLCIVAFVDHACAEVLLGRIYTYVPRPVPHTGTMCQKCGMRDIAVASEPCHLESTKQTSLPTRWLKRIPPLEELEGEKREEKQLEPV